MTEDLRIALDTPDGQRRPLFWFKAKGSSQLVWAPYSVGTKQPRLTQEWLPQLVTTEARAETFRYHFKDAQPRHLVLNHFTSHADGTFHIKLVNAETPYVYRLRRTEPLGEQTGVFLECNIMSDVATAYPAAAKHLLAPISLPVELGAGVRIHLAVAGRRFDIESAFRHHSEPNEAARRFEFAGFSALLRAWPYWPDVRLAKERFPGTFLTFRFGLNTGRDYLTAFVFE